ncbi:MAG: TMEM43 family protein [Erysipelotrichaceae bacterium]|nr:TMEM43 family protein [Erysipelotrichaceae bacterium]
MKKIIIILLLLLLTGCGEKEYTGTIEYSTGASDSELNIETEYPVLIRNVEMVQYIKEDEEVKLVFANYPIESTEEYTNPEFPEGLGNEVFYNDLSLNTYSLSEETINEIIFNENTIKKQLTDIPEQDLSEYNLIKLDDYYVTVGDDYQLGDIRISYYYIEDINVTIKAKLKDNILSVVDSKDVNINE